MAATEAPAVKAEATKAPAAMEATEAPAAMESTKEPASMEAAKAPAAMAGPADHRYYESVLDKGKYGGILIEGASLRDRPLEPVDRVLQQVDLRCPQPL